MVCAFVIGNSPKNLEPGNYLLSCPLLNTLALFERDCQKFFPIENTMVGAQEAVPLRNENTFGSRQNQIAQGFEVKVAFFSPNSGAEKRHGIPARRHGEGVKEGKRGQAISNSREPG